MDIEITRIVREEGAERLILKATDDCNLWPYIVFDTKYNEEGKVTNVHRHSYIFPNHQISKGDYVILYTGKGDKKTYNNNAKTKTHVFYWGYDEQATSIWNKAIDTVLLVKVSEYTRKSL